MRGNGGTASEQTRERVSVRLRLREGDMSSWPSQEALWVRAYSTCRKIC